MTQKENKNRITVRLPAELNSKLSKYLEPIGISKNAFILGLINKEMRKNGIG